MKSSAGGGSLWGTYDESAQESSFKDAVGEWRSGEGEADKEASEAPKYGGALWGVYDEKEMEVGFKDAVQEWRGPEKEETAHSVEVEAKPMEQKEKRSCWQCYKLHWSEVTLYGSRGIIIISKP